MSKAGVPAIVRPPAVIRTEGSANGRIAEGTLVADTEVCVRRMVVKAVFIPKNVGETTITGKNQISLPAEAVRELGWEKGDRLMVTIADENTIRLMRRPRTAEEWVEMYAGKLGHVFGDHEDTLRFLDEERRSWEPQTDDDGE
jgi:AbrB family looped-hinge helix DNA binding protein